VLVFGRLPLFTLYCRALPFLLVWLLACQSRPAPPTQTSWLTGPFQEPGPGRETEMRRLQAELAAVPAYTGEYRFRLLWRLGSYLNYSTAPDSAAPVLREARRLGQPLHQRVPIELAGVLNRLATYHWRHHTYDSARLCHYEAAQVLRRAFPDSLTQTSAQFVDGRQTVPAVMLAGQYYNAGLASSALGQLPQAMRDYEQARRAYTQAADLGGLAWVHVLFAEALQQQQQPARAAGHFEQALATLRQLAPQQPGRAAQEWASTLALYAPDLLKRQPTRLHALAREGLTLLPEFPSRTTDRDLLATATKLALLAARADLARRPAERPAGLAQAQALLPRFRVAAGADFRAALGYYVAAADGEALQAGWARARADGAAYRRYRRLAQTYRDSIADPRARAQTSLALARQLVQWRDHALAVQELRGLLPQYQTSADQAERQAIYSLLTEAYAGAGQTDSAFAAQRRATVLDARRRSQAQQAVLAEAETRYRTGLQTARIGQLTQDAAQQRRQQWLAISAAVLLALLLGGAAWVLRRTRQLNSSLEEQRALLATQAEQLTELDRTKSAFFANVSHELRTPLTLIVGPVEHLLRQGEAAWEPTLLRERLTMTLRNGRRLQGLVNGLLDFSKLDAGKLVVHPMAVQAAEFFRHLLGLFEPLAQERGLALHSTVTLPDELTLLFDADKVEKVVTNLLANALKFTPAGGQVTMTVAPDPAVADGYQLTVADTGPGIAPAEQARVFERFYQSRSHQVQGGTGIGLALSRELAELLGGQLTLRSREGEGSTFSFTFQARPTTAPAHPYHLPDPAADANAAELLGEPGEELPEELTPAAPTGPRPRVLVVEDHADLRAYLRQILQPHYEVLEAENGRVALEVLAREPVDLISSDAMMPELGGIELLQRVKAHPEWRRLPFLMLTARASAEHRLSALELGIDDYLPKPFLAHELLVRVHNLLANYHERQHWLAALADEPTPGPALEMATATQRPDGTMTVTAVAPAAKVEAAEAHAAGLLRALRELVPAILADPEYTPQLLADALGMSERTAYRRLKELTGLTPAGWLREVRLDRARQLLEARMLPTVAEVAYEVGFPNASHFTQLYSKRFGRKPSEY
jgi:signal transduction histidine kinase/DNA-binding response OmpR family regulator